MKYFFTVPGEPVGKGRPRFTKTGHTYTPAGTVGYEERVKLEFKRQCGGEPFPKGEPLYMTIEAFYGIPASAGRKKAEAMRQLIIRPTKRPDMDNIVKIIADSLNGLAYHDDSQIVFCAVHKYYSDVPRVNVCIYPKEGEKIGQ